MKFSAISIIITHLVDIKGGSMKQIYKLFSSFFFGASVCGILLVFSSVASSAPLIVGEGVQKGSKMTPIVSIQKSPKKFSGKKVAVEGKLFQQCPMADKGHGCWLRVKSEKGNASPLYIEFEANGLYFPKKLKNNSMVKVTGTIKMKGDEGTAKSGPVKKGEAYILADGAEITEK